MAKRRKYALLTAMLMTLPKMLLKFAQSVSYMLALSCRCKCTHCNMGGSCASSPAASHPICDPYCLGGCAEGGHGAVFVTRCCLCACCKAFTDKLSLLPKCEEHNRWTRGDLHVLAATCNTRTDA
eukprot:1158095-Pelagomonas_calceolata.AAC.4